ncbi:calcium-activated potassium channel subunit beta-1 [Vombatus ursinus]|uniref:Calcium-activated potassium channel subunit beta n=1 Tax=Vombatus ursinus TaxID=29139 RepID=A0A4X2JRX7_VOMUR|nr:calcium-activated potassium channel subunit beta-1 [Vombatus ursinus]XP_027697647.1 calcium-activated potassium channel subunit beta-1 [Vombatus ursinus]
MGKNLVTAQIRGESRALCLGAVMVVCSAITYYILGTTVLPLYQKSVWTKVSNCHLIEIDIREHEKLEGKKVPQYPCLWVNVSAIGKSAILYHTEETKEKNHQCSYIPENLEDYQEARRDVETIRVRFKERQNFPCYSDPDETEKSVLYRRLYTPQMLLKWLFWPTFMLTGGIFIIMMVKLNQSLSMLAAQR